MDLAGAKMFEQAVPITDMASLTAVDARSAPEIGGYRGKRTVDIVVSVLAIAVSLPLIAILALVISLDGHRPFYVQQRVGRHGRPFRMLKLRTMVPQADDCLERHLADNAGAREEWRRFQKLSDDPRITRFGRMLRKSSLDELPQLFNVLAGHMSLVGPRPIMPDQRRLYPGRAYFQMRPGITGLWQVADRNDVSFADRAKYDTVYFVSQGLVTDMTVLGRTVMTVCRMTGR